MTAHRYGAAVHSAGGFDGVTGNTPWRTSIVGALEIESVGRTIVLHIGDHDPSGEHIFVNLERDVSAFIDDMGAEGIVSFERIAVTPQQIIEFSLPTAPAKLTDRRSFAGVGDDLHRHGAGRSDRSGNACRDRRGRHSPPLG